MNARERYEQARRDFDAAQIEMNAARERLTSASQRMTRAGQDMAREARQESGKVFGPTVFGSGGLVADTVIGDAVMNVSSTGAAQSMVGVVINNGVVKRCTNCGGTSGWLTEAGVTRHTGCGAVQ